MVEALYLNGVFEEVLEQILVSQQKSDGHVCYLQPYSTKKIKLLAEHNPTPENPIRVYISLTDSLSVVSFRALIVAWRDKREMTVEEVREINRRIRARNCEEEIYRTGGEEQIATNLISIIKLERLLSPIPVSSFIKTSDKMPLKPRTHPGRWAYVYELPSWVGMQAQTEVEEQMVSSFEEGVKKSLATSTAARKGRLETASRIPEVVQVISRAYRRNADVVAEVLARAAGFCEQCKGKALFLRAKDGMPYLEVHHRVTLASGGEDTVENALALCPNCYRKMHFG
jgi:hypothetical protein